MDSFCICIESNKELTEPYFTIDDVKYGSMDDEARYKRLCLELGLKKEYTVITGLDGFKPIEVIAKSRVYNEYDFNEFIIQYRLKYFKLVCFHGFFDIGLLPDNNFNFRQQPTDDLKMLDIFSDYYNFTVKCERNVYQILRFPEYYQFIPEFVDNERYCMHPIYDFFTLDFKKYFNSEHSIEDLVDKNLYVWSHIFEPKIVYDNSRLAKARVIKTLLNNPNAYAVKLLKNRIQKGIGVNM
jgi:hypothetical protein